MSAEGQKFYPGNEATPVQLMQLAAEWRRAAGLLWDARRRRAPLSFAPYRFVAIHAVELYLNAFLQAKGHAPKAVRGMQHNLAARTALAVEAGLKLRPKTRAHLKTMTGSREHLVARYGPEQIAAASELNRVGATLNEFATEVEAVVVRRA
jgi:hypothetical protein